MKLTNITHPSTTQKQVLATIISSATSQLADEYISKNANMVAARQMLERLGLVATTDNGIELTDNGWQVSTEEGIVSEPHGDLTRLGQQLSGETSEPSINQPPNSPEFPVDDSETPVNSEIDTAGQPSEDDMEDAPVGGMVRPGVGANVANVQ